MRDGSWLIDKSALARIRTSPDGKEWTRRIERGLVQITTATILEVGYSAPTPSELHVDKDFDLIAEVTGQPVQRLTVS